VLVTATHLGKRDGLVADGLIADVLEKALQDEGALDNLALWVGR